MKGKINTPTAKRQPTPMSAKAAAGKMGELMTRKVTKTQQMREQKPKTAKYR
jgi:hypothetical protein